MSTPPEGYRRTLRVRTAEGDAVTLIVSLQRGHRHGRVWLSFGATTQTTVALSGAEVGELTGALHAAAGNGGGATPSETAVNAGAAALTADVMGRVLQPLGEGRAEAARARHRAGDLDTYGHLWSDTDENSRKVVEAIFMGGLGGPSYVRMSVSARPLSHSQSAPV